MTTLLDNELFDYLAHLEGEVDKRISTSNEGSFQHLMHSQMKSVIETEKEFLKYINSNGTQPILAFSGNGLPSVESLSADLEKICELAKDENSFTGLAQRFRKDMNGKDKDEDSRIYAPISEDNWLKMLKEKKEKLFAKPYFSISETEEGKFQLKLREDHFLKGIDDFSKKYPFLYRKGSLDYHIAWGRLFYDEQYEFCAPNKDIIKKGNKSLAIRDDMKERVFFEKKDPPTNLDHYPYLVRGNKEALILNNLVLKLAEHFPSKRFEVTRSDGVYEREKVIIRKRSFFPWGKLKETEKLISKNDGDPIIKATCAEEKEITLLVDPFLDYGEQIKEYFNEITKKINISGEVKYILK